MKRSYFLALLILSTLAFLVAQVEASPLRQQNHGIAPTYIVFATRQGMVGSITANNHTIQPRDRFVALPSAKALCSYQGSEYQVRVTYRGRSVVVPVWDVGPWNVDDDYWSSSRKYKDLPVGVPMAQAAYLENYHGGLDEFGRKVGLPNGIDIADGTFWDDLGMTKSDWVQVSFLWLGNDPGPGNAANVVPPPNRGQQAMPESKPSSEWTGKQEDSVGSTHQQTTPSSPTTDSGAIAVDDGDSEHSVNNATWYRANCGLNGSHSWTYSTNDAGHSENHAIWRPRLSAGRYEVKAYIPACGNVNATQSAQYRVTHNGQVTEVSLDQQAAAGTWASLGTYEFGSDNAQLIELSDVTKDSMRAVRFDAIQWVPVGKTDREKSSDSQAVNRVDTTPPTSRIVSIKRHKGGFLVQWEGSDDMSGVASYDIHVRILPKGGWRKWMIETTATSSWLGPDEGKHFAFRIRARDYAGNEQPWTDQEIDTSQAKE